MDERKVAVTHPPLTISLQSTFPLMKTHWEGTLQVCVGGRGDLESGWGYQGCGGHEPGATTEGALEMWLF